MDRYVGLDAHPASCTFGVLGPSGKRLKSMVVETNGAALVEAVRSTPGRFDVGPVPKPEKGSRVSIHPSAVPPDATGSPGLKAMPPRSTD
jgi:hypothetical protein